MKKKILSVVAAGAVAVGMVGCGGNGSPEGKGQPTKIMGVDGYVMNAKVVVKYWDDDKNESKTKEIDKNKLKDSYYLIYDKATDTTQRPGKKDYVLADLNKTVLEHIISVELQSQPSGTLEDGSSYFQSFFDAEGDGVYDSNDTIMDYTLKAPKGFSVVTPITTIIAAKVESVFNGDKNESNLTEVIDTYTEKMAKALGVSKDTIKKVDPLTLRNSKDEKAKAFAAVNSLLGKLVEDNSNNLVNVFDGLDVNPPKNKDELFDNAAEIAQKAGNTGVALALKKLKNYDLDKVVNLNLDKIRESIENNGNFDPVSFDIKPEEFNATIEAIVAAKNGYKIKSNDLDDIKIKLEPNEKNVSTKTIYFVAHIWNPRERMETDPKVNRIALKVPVEINSTEGQIKAQIPGSAKILVVGINKEGEIVKFENNLTVMNITKTDIVPEVENDNILKFKLKTLVDEIEKNLTNSNKTNIFCNNAFPLTVSNIQLGIVDKDNSLTYVKKDGNEILPILPMTDRITFMDINEKVVSIASFKENDFVADMRAGVDETRENKEPDNYVVIYDENDKNKTTLSNKNGVKIGDLNINGREETNDSARLVLENNESYGIYITEPTVDSWERNLTVDITLGNYLTDVNTSLLASKLEANTSQEANVSNVFKVKDVTTAGKILTDITFKFKDEFGEENETKLYAIINRPFKNEHNTTSFKPYDDENKSLLIASDLDGFDVSKSWIELKENNNSDANISDQWTKINVNADTNVTARLSLKENNTKLILEFSTSFGTSVIGEDSEWNLSIKEWNLTGNVKDDHNGTGVNVLFKP